MPPSPEGQSGLDFTGETQVNPADDRKQILSLSGGGFRGLFSARLLEHLEAAMNGHRLRSRFKLIAGTSIGAILAAALAAEIPATKIREIMESAGPKIFAGRGIRSGLKQFFWKAPYSRQPLVAVLDELFNAIGKSALLDTPIKDCNLPLMLTAVSASTHRPKIFTPSHLSIDPSPSLSFDPLPPVTLREAILASAAAPTYFPSLKTARHTLIDGGLIANAPDVIALGILHRKIGAPLDKCFCLSIGTASPRVAVKKPEVKSSGILRWILSRRGLIQLTLDAQEALAIQTMDLLMGTQFVRLDTDPLANKNDITPQLDRADGAAIELLKRLADDLWEQRQHDPAILSFIATQPGSKTPHDKPQSHSV